MKIYLAIFALAFQMTSVAASELSETKKQAIERFLTVMDVYTADDSLNSDIKKAIISELQNKYPDIDQNTIRRVEAEVIRFTDEYNLEKRLDNAERELIGSRFTTAEINELSDFFSGTTWKKYIRFEKNFDADFKGLAAQHIQGLKDILGERIKKILDDR